MSQDMGFPWVFLTWSLIKAVKQFSKKFWRCHTNVIKCCNVVALVKNRSQVSPLWPCPVCSAKKSAELDCDGGNSQRPGNRGRHAAIQSSLMGSLWTGFDGGMMGDDNIYYDSKWGMMGDELLGLCMDYVWIVNAKAMNILWFSNRLLTHWKNMKKSWKKKWYEMAGNGDV